MTNSAKHLELMTDVIALSQQNCSRPISANLVYATPQNFVGKIIDGYTPNVTNLALMTTEAAKALCKVQNDLIKNYNLSLLIYDSYRPKRAVLNFVKWSVEPVTNEYELERKKIHYPHIEKNQLFDLHYVSADSQHCYGHTVDLVLIDEHGNELDHGACFDYMDALSHLTCTAQDIGEVAVKNREILSQTMQEHGFIPYQFEYWHFSYHHKVIKEPMDTVITADLRGWNVG